MARCLAGARTGVGTERSKIGPQSDGEFPLVHKPVTGERQEGLSGDPSDLEWENKSWIFSGNRLQVSLQPAGKGIDRRVHLLMQK